MGGSAAWPGNNAAIDGALTSGQNHRGGYISRRTLYVGAPPHSGDIPNIHGGGAAGLYPPESLPLFPGRLGVRCAGPARDVDISPAREPRVICALFLPARRRWEGPLPDTAGVFIRRPHWPKFAVRRSAMGRGWAYADAWLGIPLWRGGSISPILRKMAISIARDSSPSRRPPGGVACSGSNQPRPPHRGEMSRIVPIVRIMRLFGAVDLFLRRPTPISAPAERPARRRRMTASASSPPRGFTGPPYFPPPPAP